MPEDTPQRVALAASLAVAALGCLLLALYIHRIQREIGGGPGVSLLALSQDVDRGTPITESLVVVHDVPEKYVESSQVRHKDLRRVLGVRAAVHLQANQTLRWTDLSISARNEGSLSERIPRGMRAVTVEHVDRRLFGGLLRPGDRVDVLLTSDVLLDREGAVTVPLLQNALVLAVGESMGGPSEPQVVSTPSVVTVLVDADDASLLAHAKREGVLSLTLRNHDDLETRESWVPTDRDDIVAQQRSVPRRRRAALERVD